MPSTPVGPDDDVSALPADPPPAPRSKTVTVVGVFAVLGIAATMLAGGALNPPATTEDGDFAGETLEVMIPLAEGGGTDTWARFVGQDLAHFIPGDPGFAPVNEDGGEGITGSNHFALSAGATGAELLVSTATTVVPWVLERDVVKYSFADMIPILVNGTGGVVYARTDAGVEGVDDLVNRDEPLVFGGITATGLDLTTLVAFDLLDADVDSTFGFEGRGPVNLALQRGEVDIDYTTTSAYGPSVEPLVESGEAVVLMSFGQLDADGEVVRDPSFPDVPTVVEVYEELHGEKPSGDAFEAYRTLLGLTYTYQKGLWVPKGTPAAAVDLLRASAQRMAEDDAFNQRAAEVLGGYPILADDSVAESVSAAYTVSEATRDYVLDLLADDYDITVH
ncbi:Bug family tripartite tricarboxylate transporter substrate binding protein [Microbacterium sp. JZ101]